MRTMILMGCFYLNCIVGHAQGNGRIGSGTPFRWSMNGSVEIMEGDLTKHYGSSDSGSYKNNSTTKALISNPHATRISSVQAQCDNNSMIINWTAQQHEGSTDRFELEQSDDAGSNWKKIGGVLATQTPGQLSYSFKYQKNTANSLFRVVTVSTNGERFSSSVFESSCSPTSFLSVTPNPVQSTTTLRIASPTATKAKLLLMYSNGLVIQTRDVSLSEGINSLSWDMSKLQTGYYTLAIQWMGGKQDVLNVIKR